MNLELGSGLIAEFEKRFGRTLTNVVLFLVLMAVVVICLGIILSATRAVYVAIGDLMPSVEMPAFDFTLTALYVTALAGIGTALFSIFQYFALRRAVPQSVVNKLAVFRKTAIDKLLNGPVTNEQEFRAWEAEQSAWRENVIDFLKEHFPPAEVLGFESLGAIQPVAFPHAFNNEHNFKLSKLVKRLSILEDIIRRHTR